MDKQPKAGPAPTPRTAARTSEEAKGAKLGQHALRDFLKRGLEEFRELFAFPPEIARGGTVHDHDRGR